MRAAGLASIRRLWVELKRRKVVAVTLTYVAGAAAVIQTVSSIRADVGLPESSTRITIVFALIGLPIAVLLAWLFEVRPEPATAETTGTPPVEPAPVPVRVYHPAQPITPFIGRESELAQAAELLRDPAVRLITITGLGGMGKTRLAHEIAIREQSGFAHGAVIIPLAGTEDAESLPGALADALEFQLSPREDATRQLVDFLQQKHLLMVLDNFEHLLDATALVTDLLAGTIGVRLLVTSRRRLNIAAETVIPLDSLPLPADAEPIEQSPAARLFLQVARRIDRTLDVADPDVSYAIRRICKVTDGMPLALELAASSVGVLSCPEIAWELEQRHEVLLGLRRDLPPRHQSLHAAFESSWRLLDTEEQRVFRNLSVFRAGFDRDAAEAVAGANLTVLARLVDASLVRRVANGRFEILEVLRQIAEEKLAEDPAQAQQMRQRHSEYVLEQLARLAAFDEGRNRDAALEGFADWLADVRQAWVWAIARDDFRRLDDAARALYLLLEAKGRSAEGADLFQRAADALRMAIRSETAGEGVRLTLARVLAAQAAFDLDLGRVSRASLFLNEAVPVLRAEGDRAELAFAVLKQAHAARLNGDYRSPNYQEALTLYRALEDRRGVARALNSLGTARQGLGEYDDARRLYREAVTLLREQGLESEVWTPLNNLAGIAQVEGDFAGAAAILEEALAAIRPYNNTRALTFLLTNLGLVKYRAQDYDAALAALAESIALSREMGYRARVAYSLNTLANIYNERYELNAADRSFREALRVADAAEEMPLVPSILLGIARLNIKSRDYALAHSLVQAVAQHPTCDEETRTEAQNLLPQIPEAERTDSTPWSLDEAVRAVLAQPAAVTA